MDFIVTFSYCVWLYFVVVYQKNLCPIVCQMLVQILKTAGGQDPSSVLKF